MTMADGSVTVETPSLGVLLMRSAADYPDRKALVMPDLLLRYDELLQKAAAVARGLLAMGFSSRSHIGILANNSEELVAALFGTWLADCVAIPINARNKAHELQHVVTDARLQAVLTTARDTTHVDFPDLLCQAFPDLANQPCAERLNIGLAPDLRAIVLLAGADRAGFIGADQFYEKASTVSVEAVHGRHAATRPRDPAAILYTSGTTSAPKGCILSHEALVRGPVGRASGRLRSFDHDVTWGGGPLFHIGSLGAFIGCIGTGGTYVTDIVFDAERALGLMEREGVTTAWPWFPALLQPLLDHPQFDAARLPKLSKALVIAPESLVVRAQQALPQTEFLQACGMTETAGIFALSSESDTAQEKAVFQGRPVDGVSIRIIHPETGQDMRPGGMGEILVRGYCVTDGYYGDPVKTAQSLTADDWLHTGDLYILHPNGQLQFCGRLKDMLKVGGENVAAREIEDYLCSHLAIRTAQVIGRADDRLDEVPVAFIELEPGFALSADEVIGFCRGTIASFKVPRAVKFVDAGDWPMSLTKIDKGKLRERLQ